MYNLENAEFLKTILYKKLRAQGLGLRAQRYLFLTSYFLPLISNFSFLISDF